MSDDRKKKEKAERAEYILDCVEELIGSRRFEEITFDGIAEASGYTKRSVSLYFEDKSSLYFSLVLRGQKKMMEVLKSALQRETPDGLIENLADAFYDFSINHTGYFELVMQYEIMSNRGLESGSDQSDEPRELCNALSNKYGKLILEALVQDMEENNIQSLLTPRQLLLVLWSQIFGFLQAIITRRNGFKDVYGIGEKDLYRNYIRAIAALYRKGMAVE